MVILILNAVKPGLRGELSRWMIEPHAGVFVGHVSGRIRDKLWDKVMFEAKEGDAILIFTARNEQGFEVRHHGDPDRYPVNYDGLTLIARRKRH
jgi:CRISPR-associated protein Cas2